MANHSTSTAPSIEERRAQAVPLLASYGQTHLLDGWPDLTDEQRLFLLDQIDRIDFPLVRRLYQDLVLKNIAPFSLPPGWTPAEPAASIREEARRAGHDLLHEKDGVRYGILVVAGGSGSGLKFPHAKGLFPGTPLSRTPLYEALVRKSEVAARSHGHARMFPMVIMVSDETEADTRAYFEDNDFFGERDRIRFARQTTLPLLERRPGSEGRIFMTSPWQIAFGGAGHGDAFDHVLSRDEATVTWLKGHGVRYLQFANVDNLLNPFADPGFLGEHALSESPAEPGRAHISVALIPKAGASRLGNIIQHSAGRTLQESVDYGIFPEVDQLCVFGHASLQIVSLDSLARAEPIPFMATQKEVRRGDDWAPAWKFERSSNNKRRYGALVRYDASDVFAPIKKRPEDALEETPVSAAERQSEHWKRRVAAAGGATGRSWTIPDTAVLELPWEADHLSPRDLSDRLVQCGLPPVLAPYRGYLVSDGFHQVREMTLEDTVFGQVPPPPDRFGRRARRWTDQSPDEHRLRALLAHFSNVFESEPDVLVRAPGRNTLIGDHQDYPPLPQDGSAHSYTIAWASRKSVLVAARRRPDHALKICSVNTGQFFSISLDDLEGLAEEAALGNLPDIYGQELYPWAMNILALLYSAHHGRDGVRSGLPIEGAEFAVEGNIPMGAGQSSSAAFLVAMALACNEVFNWGIPRTDIVTLADLARSGEHEDYSPFIQKGLCGYLDQITSLAALPGKAVLIDHGDYHHIRAIDLSFLEGAGYTNAVVLSGLSRSLAETDYMARVEELTRLPRVMNRLLARHRRPAGSRNHVHQFTHDEWRLISEDLEREDPTLARRARYLFEENGRTLELVDAVSRQDVAALVSLVNASGEGMSMRGPYQISGFNQGPESKEPFHALDELRSIVLRHAGSGAAARLIGGGGAGPLCLLVRTERLKDPLFARRLVTDWRAKTGLQATVEVDPPSAGAEVLWRRRPARVIKERGPRRIALYVDALGEPVYRLIDDEAGSMVDVLGFRGSLRGMSCRIDGVWKSVLYNPEENPAENGAAPYLGPWINRIKDGRASFHGQRVNLMNVGGVRDDGHGHALHGLMTVGWKVDEEASAIEDDAIRLVSSIETRDYTDHEGVQRLFGPSRTVLTHRLTGTTLAIESDITHLPGERPGHRIPVLAAVHPWFLLSRRKHAFAVLTLAGRRHRLTWKKIVPRLQMIPVPFLPSLPILPFSRHNFREGRALGMGPYDDVYTRLEPHADTGYPVATLKDWFRDMMFEVGVTAGFDEFTVFRRGGDHNFVCLEPQIGSINALGPGAPVDATIPTIAAGETFHTGMYIRVSSLSARGVRSPFAAEHPVPLRPASSPNLPILVRNGLEAGPIAEPGMTTTHKDATRVFFKGRWHIYGTGHEMRDLRNPPPGHRPHRRSIMFHLVADDIDGPYREEHPPVLLGDFPPGIYEAPGLAVEGDCLHLFAQTTYYRLGGTIERFESRDGQTFVWAGQALRPLPRTHQGGIYDADATEWDGKKLLLYSGFSREGGRDDRPDPWLYLAESKNGWEGPFTNGRAPILTDQDIRWHNSHHPGNPIYEWGLEGAQIIQLPGGRHLLLSVAFEKRPGRAYMAAQRLLFALYDERMNLIEVSNPILPLAKGWDEYGHGSMMIDPVDPGKLRLLFQARPENPDKCFRDSDSWRLFESVFDISHLSYGTSHARTSRRLSTSGPSRGRTL